MSLISETDSPWWAFGLSLTFVVVLIYVLAPSPVTVAVRGTRFPFEPATIRLYVTVEPHEDNRWLIVGLQDGDFTIRRSDEALAGEKARRVREVPFANVGAGHLIAFAVIQRADGTTATARDTVTVQARF